MTTDAYFNSVEFYDNIMMLFKDEDWATLLYAHWKRCVPLTMSVPYSNNVTPVKSGIKCSKSPKIVTCRISLTMKMTKRRVRELWLKKSVKNGDGNDGAWKKNVEKLFELDLNSQELMLSKSLPF